MTDAEREHAERLAKQIDSLTIECNALRTKLLQTECREQDYLAKANARSIELRYLRAQLGAEQPKDWRTLADLIMDLGAEYWRAAVRERGAGAVQWMHNEETGALFIFTRGEYVDYLKYCLRQLPGEQERPVETSATITKAEIGKLQP